MMESVPQFIDVEDKIAGPFTGKQLLWLFGFTTIAIVLWQFLEFTAFIIAIIPIGGIFAAFMFWKPNGQSLINYVMAAVSFVFRPKLYVWRRMYQKKGAAIKKKQEQAQVKEKEMTPEELQKLTQMLDTRGGSRQ